MVDDQIHEFRKLQDELNEHRSNLGMLLAQRNENEMVKQVSVGAFPIHIFQCVVGRRLPLIYGHCIFAQMTMCVCMFSHTGTGCL